MKQSHITERILVNASSCTELRNTFKGLHHRILSNNSSINKLKEHKTNKSVKHLRYESQKLPSIGRIPTKPSKRIKIRENRQIRDSYISLSMMKKRSLNETDPPINRNMKEINFKSSKLPFPIIRNDDTTLTIEDNTNDLNPSIKDTISSIIRKTEMKANQIDYSQIESAKMFAKCFVAAFHSLKENLSSNSTDFLLIAKIIYSLFSQAQNFIELVNKTITKLKDSQRITKKEAENVKNELELLENNFETKLESIKEMYEEKVFNGEYKKLKGKYAETKLHHINENKTHTAQIVLLENRNIQLSKELKKLKEDSNINFLNTTINELKRKINFLENELKTTQKEKNCIGFKLYNFLEAGKLEEKERDVIISKLIDEHKKLIINYNAACEEVKRLSEEIITNVENISMAQEDALCSSIRCRAKQHELEKKAIEIGDMTKRIS